MKKLQNHFINELSVKTCGNVSRHARFHLRTRQRDTKTDDLVLTCRNKKKNRKKIKKKTEQNKTKRAPL